MDKKFDFKNEVEKIREQLVKLSNEAAKVAKKGEKEIVKFSKVSKMHIDATAAALKKEKLFYSLGKKYKAYLDSSKAEAANQELIKMYEEVKQIEQEEKKIKSKLKSKKK